VTVVELARSFTCPECGSSFSLSARNARAHRARGTEPVCRACRIPERSLSDEERLELPAGGSRTRACRSSSCARSRSACGPSSPWEVRGSDRARDAPARWSAGPHARLEKSSEDHE
jgi:hypothetical protein